MRTNKNLFINLDALLTVNDDKDYPFLLDQAVKQQALTLQKKHDNEVTIDIYYDAKNCATSDSENNPIITFFAGGVSFTLSKGMFLSVVLKQLTKVYPALLENANFHFFSEEEIIALKQSSNSIFITRPDVTALESKETQSAQPKKTKTVCFPINPIHFSDAKEKVIASKGRKIIISLDLDDTITDSAQTNSRNGIVLNQDLVDKLAELIIAAGGTDNIEFMILSARRQDDYHDTFCKTANVLPFFVNALKEKIAQLDATLEPNITFDQSNVFCLMRKQIIKYVLNGVTHYEFLEKPEVQALARSLRLSKVDVIDLDARARKNKASFIRHYLYPKKLAENKDALFLHFDDDEEQLSALMGVFKYNSSAVIMEVFRSDRMAEFDLARADYLKSQQQPSQKPSRLRNTLFAARKLDETTAQFFPSPTPKAPSLQR